VTVGRPTLFQTVMEWGTPWRPASEKREEQRRGEAYPPFSGGHHPAVTV
jgi:hypothetical protein